MNKTIFDFEELNDWHETNDFLDTSSKSEKVWLKNSKTNSIALFKYPKSEETFEHISEHLAFEIGKLLGIQCSEIHLGIFNSRKGSLSYLVHDINTESLIEGVNFIQVQFPTYDSDKLIDPTSNKIYSVEMIISSLISNTLRQEFMYVLLFDFIIGNSDRHQNNWALIRDEEGYYRLSPLYDNGSSLCSYVPEDKIPDFLSDHMRFNALVDTKSRSRIGLNNIKKPKHSEIIQYLLDSGYLTSYEILFWANRLSRYINSLLNRYENVISQKRIELLKRFILEKINILKRLCGKEEKNYE